jgi:uncharacterized protein YjiS (DUF1127 family)
MAYSLIGERPRTAARPLRLLAGLFARFYRAAAAYRRRQMLDTLLELDDYRLRDLGISRHDIAEALSRPDYSLAAVRDRRCGALPPSP